MMKKVLVTGGSDGLGAAFGRLCVSQGISVVCLSRTLPDYPAAHIPLDLLDPLSIERAVQTIEKDHPDFDALIHCAGVFSEEDPAHVSYTELDRVIRTNSIAPAYLTGRLMDQICTNNADIMNVGSTVGTKAYPDQMAYGMSKWAMRGLSANLQLELKNTKCRVIQFNPGGFQSRLVEKFDHEQVDLSAYMNPEDLATLMMNILSLPKSVEVSEILINRR